MFKKLLLSILASVFVFACGASNQDRGNKLVIGVSPIPHSEIVNLVKDDLKAEGVELEVVVFDDYVQPNLKLGTKELDANFFQHVPYMESFAKEHNLDLVSVGGVHLEPLKIYSDKIKDVSELADGSEILIPNDPTNRGRALLLLESAGLITLKDHSKLDSSVDDIASNPKNLSIVDLNAEQIPPRLSEVAAAVINTNVALSAKISGDKAILVEGKDSPYVNVVTVLKGNENEEKIQKLIKALQSDKVRKFIEEQYKGEVEVGF